MAFYGCKGNTFIIILAIVNIENQSQIAMVNSLLQVFSVLQFLPSFTIHVQNK